jgi:hypothetical protein
LAVRAMKKDNARALESLARIRVLTPVSHGESAGKTGLIPDRS